jgi:hypothetical protein
MSLKKVDTKSKDVKKDTKSKDVKKDSKSKDVKKDSKKKNLKGGSHSNQDIPLPTLTSLDWHNKGQQPIPYTADTSVGINEYQFGRTTPNNEFIVSSGLVLGKDGLEMTAPDMTGLNNLGLGKGPTGVLPQGISSCGTVDTADNKMSGGSKSKKTGDKKKKSVTKPKEKKPVSKPKKTILKTIKNELVSVGTIVEKQVKKLFTGKSKKVDKKPVKKDKKPVKKEKKLVKKEKKPVKKEKKTVKKDKKSVKKEKKPTK